MLASPWLPCTVPLVASLRLPSVQQQRLLWLLGCFGFLVLGELVIAPLGFAMMNRVVAPQQVGLINALWYAAVAAGFVLAGEFGSLLQQESEWLWFGYCRRIADGCSRDPQASAQGSLSGAS